jgi:hypothetical protein
MHLPRSRSHNAHAQADVIRTILQGGMSDFMHRKLGKLAKKNKH